MIHDSTQFPVKYILYSHYGYYERVDETTFLEHGSDEEFQGTSHLCRYLSGLDELLNTPGHEGMLVLFYAPGFRELLEEIEKVDRRRLLEKAEFANAICTQIRARLKKAGLEMRVRLITAVEMTDLLGAVHPSFAEHFRRFITGSASALRYDAPKIVEAIIRLRLLGTGVPVFRLDQDVLFGSENEGKPDLGLFKPIACAVRAYQLRHENPNVTTFLFSASYNHKAVLVPSKRQDRFAAWSRAFPTRVFPAIVADPVEIVDIVNRGDADQNETWQQYLKENFDERLARRFYGLKSAFGTLVFKPLEGISAVGAHPLYAVISGALLCLSEGAILDLPPFSNFRNNVMWIDDHLKYALHRAMNHFTNRERPHGDPGLSFARLEDVVLTKSRPPVGNLPVYVFGTYLPTLLWGAVMDAWISDDPLVKRRGIDLSAAERARRDAARDRPPTAVLPRILYEALRTNHPTTTPEQRRELEKVALSRINAVRAQWSSLTHGRLQTFASYWARGEVKRAFGREMFAGEEELLWQGIGGDLGKPITHFSQINNLRSHLTELIDDALTYVTWTTEWPRFVQIVRSTRQGDFAADISWRPRE